MERSGSLRTARMVNHWYVGMVRRVYSKWSIEKLVLTRFLVAISPRSFLCLETGASLASSCSILVRCSHLYISPYQCRATGSAGGMPPDYPRRAPCSSSEPPHSPHSLVSAPLDVSGLGHVGSAPNLRKTHRIVWE